MALKLRNPNIIAESMVSVRTGKYSIESWTLDEVMSDIESLALGITDNIAKINDWKTRLQKENKKAYKRIRNYTKAIETLGVKFRTLSIEDGKED